MILRQHCIKNRHDSVMEITAWVQKHFQKSVCEHSTQCNPQMQVKSLSCKKEAICEQDSETSPSSLSQSSFKNEPSQSGRLFRGYTTKRLITFCKITSHVSSRLKRIIAQSGTALLSQRSSSCSSQFQYIYRLLSKEERMLLRHVAAV